ncbi:hypothetical protein GA0070607_5102 [Micromonospora coriariae]|uniref:Uncharacterized protein n=1 Tax=Micromonospora coriariae TaxID=285665 RepID=A0A1C4XDX8_9ACTN|nr:hypothetical protein [Micromonospora coriariae]SCF06532.1 hypothetical protein GA0070607_5102 [Micromonospora coriariae]
MAARRWDAWFEEEHLVLRRWRLLPWPRTYVRRIPLAAILDIGSLTAADHAKRRAQLTVQDTSAPHLTEVIPVRFTSEQWAFAGWFMGERQAVPIEPPQPGAGMSSGGATSPHPTVDVPAQSRRRVQPPAALQAHLSAKPASFTPSSKPATPSTTPVMRAGDGKRPVWLWSQNGKIQASLVPVANASQHRLGPADVAHLLLADPSRAMPAIRALTGLADSQQALAHLRSWQRSDPVVVNLSASDLAGRRVTEALQKPGRSNPDGSVRTVSGGLPSLNKRRR